MIFAAPRVSADELARVTGWHLRPEGLCREDRCVPFATADDSAIDLTAVAAALRMPLVHDAPQRLWALGAESGGRALTSVTAPDLTLPDANGKTFRLSSLLGRKVQLVVWASW